MTAFNDIPIRVNGPVRVRRVNNGAGVAGRANARDGIEIRPSNKGKTVEGRRVMAHEMAHMMDYRDLDERQRQHIGQAILGGKWDAEKFAEYAAWAAVMPKSGKVVGGSPGWSSKRDRVSALPAYGVKLDAKKLDVLRKWLVNIPLYRRAQ
mgnify:CR=1 FL=1